MVAIWPVIFLAFIVSLVSVWLNDVAVTWGVAVWIESSYRALKISPMGCYERNDHFPLPRCPFMSKTFRVIHSFDLRSRYTPKRIHHPSRWWHKRHLNLNTETNQLKIVLQDTQFDVGSNFYGEWPDKFEYEIPLTSLAGPRHATNRPSDTALRESNHALLLSKKYYFRSQTKPSCSGWIPTLNRRLNGDDRKGMAN